MTRATRRSSGACGPELSQAHRGPAERLLIPQLRSTRSGAPLAERRDGPDRQPDPRILVRYPSRPVPRLNAAPSCPPCCDHGRPVPNRFVHHHLPNRRPYFSRTTSGRGRSGRARGPPPTRSSSSSSRRRLSRSSSRASMSVSRSARRLTCSWRDRGTRQHCISSSSVLEKSRGARGRVPVSKRPA